MTFANWSYPTDIKFGAGRIEELESVCKKHAIRRPLFVTDSAIMELANTKNIIKSISRNLNCQVFTDIDSNPTEKNLMSGIKIFQSGNHDGVIAFGGGSSLDIGKLIAFMAPQLRPVWDFEDIDDWWMRADSKNISPIVAVPTTAGTGSEVGRASVLTNSVSKEKKIIFHPKILPSSVICDPVLTLTLPKIITSGTGLDALAHCVEAYCSPSYHPMCQGIALEGIKLVKDNLLMAYENGSNLHARSNMMSAALMGAVAFQKGLGAVHAISHPIGAIYNTHHGLTNAILLPHILEFNRNKIEQKINDLSAYLDINQGFDGFLFFVKSLNLALDIPRGLSDLGVLETDIKKIVNGALQDPSKDGNPVKLNSTNLEALILKAM